MPFSTHYRRLHPLRGGWRIPSAISLPVHPAKFLGQDKSVAFWRGAGSTPSRATLDRPCPRRSPGLAAADLSRLKLITMETELTSGRCQKWQNKFWQGRGKDRLRSHDLMSHPATPPPATKICRGRERKRSTHSCNFAHQHNSRSSATLTDFGNGRGAKPASNRKLRFIRARHRALIPKTENQSSVNVTSTHGAQPVGQRPADCISVKIQSHAKSLAEESRAKNDVPMLQWRNQTIRNFPNKTENCPTLPLRAVRRAVRCGLQLLQGAWHFGNDTGARRKNHRPPVDGRRTD